jgi:hypothetical protein
MFTLWSTLEFQRGSSYHEGDDVSWATEGITNTETTNKTIASNITIAEMCPQQ